MKKFLQVIIACLFAINGFSQSFIGPDSILDYNWLPEEAKYDLLPSGKVIYTYDNKGKPIEEIRGSNSNGDIVFTSRIVRKYYNDGKVESTSSYSRKSDTSSWNQHTLVLYTYNETESINTSLIIGYNPDGSIQTYNKYDYYYNTNKLADSLKIYLGVHLDSLRFSSRTVYTYDEKGRFQSSISQFFGNNEYVNNSKSSEVYDDNDNLVIYQFALWESTSMEWQPLVEYHYKYDENGFNQNTINIGKNFITNKLDTTFQSIYERDDAGNLLESYYSNFDNISRTFNKSSKSVYFYSLISDLKNLSELVDVKVYPNPTSDYILLENKSSLNLQLSLYDLNGTLLDTKMGNSQIFDFNLGEKPNGTYFIRAINTANSSQQTFNVIKVN